MIDDAKKRESSEFYRSFVTWFEDFCKYVQAPATKAPLDFFSWHLYVSNSWPVDRIATHAEYVRKTLDAAGRAFLVSNTGAESVDVRISGVEKGSFEIFRVDAGHPTLASTGTWQFGQPLALPPSGFVLALDIMGPRLESTGGGTGATAHPANGLQQ